MEGALSQESVKACKCVQCKCVYIYVYAYIYIVQVHAYTHGLPYMGCPYSNLTPSPHSLRSSGGTAQHHRGPQKTPIWSNPFKITCNLEYLVQHSDRSCPSYWPVP